MRRIILSFILLSVSLVMSGQPTFEQIKKDPRMSAGNHRVYPVNEITPQTPAPEGFEPVFVYMICRHGSRYINRTTTYGNTLNTLEAADSAGALTRDGKKLLGKMRVICEEARGREGQLTRTGEAQLRGIAERMYANYPEIFSKAVTIDAKSTQVERVILTMVAFSERMKELNPSLNILKDCDFHDEYEWGSDIPGYETVSSDTASWRKALNEYRDAHLDFDKIAGRIIKPSALENICPDTKRFILPLMEIASNVQDMDIPYDKYQFYDIFTDEELWSYCKAFTYEQFVIYGCTPTTAPIVNVVADHPLELVAQRAEKALQSEEPSACLRFCHDGNVGRWLAAMRVPGAFGEATGVDEMAEIYNSVPMASNIQFVLYKNAATGKVLAKIMLRECETSLPIPYAAEGAPYYEWPVLREFLLSIPLDN